MFSISVLLPFLFAGGLMSLSLHDGGADASALKPPEHGSIPVAFVLSEGAVVIDYSGPWEVFQDADVPGRHEDAPPFQLYTVAETSNPITVSAGMKVVPNYTFANAPKPKIIVIPAQRGRSEVMLGWIRESSKTADLTMSVCTGAFVLAGTGLLSGKAATTHHDAYARLAHQFPDIQVKRGFRFVEEGNIATAGGLTSGIDLALRVVERYFGRKAAERTAFYMEYQGKGWMDSSGRANAIYADASSPASEQKTSGASKNETLDPVCGMAVDSKSAADSHLTSKYKGATYYFCQQDCKRQFDASPADFVKAPQEAAKK